MVSSVKGAAKRVIGSPMQKNAAPPFCRRQQKKHARKDGERITVPPSPALFFPGFSQSFEKVGEEQSRRKPENGGGFLNIHKDGPATPSHFVSQAPPASC